MSLTRFDSTLLREAYLRSLELEASRPGLFTKDHVASLNSPHDYIGYFIGVVEGSCEWIYLMPQISMEFAIKAGADLESLQTFVEKSNVVPSSWWERAAIESGDPVRALSDIQKLGADLRVTVRDVFDHCHLEDKREVISYVKDVEAKRGIVKLAKKLHDIYGADLSDHLRDVHTILDAVSS